MITTRKQPPPASLIEPAMLSVPQFAALLNISESLGWLVLREGKLPAYKVGRLTRIRRADAMAWIEQRPRAEFMEMPHKQAKTLSIVRPRAGRQEA